MSTFEERQKHLDEVCNYLIYVNQSPQGEEIQTADEAHEQARTMHRMDPEKWHEVYRVYLVDDYFPKGTRNGISQWKPWDCPEHHCQLDRCGCIPAAAFPNQMEAWIRRFTHGQD